MVILTLAFDTYIHNGFPCREKANNVKWEISSLGLQNSQV